jgi:glutathionylspermidine synthase
MVRTSLRAGRYITICRLDGYVDRGTGQLKLLENNSDAPAGILFSPRLNGLVRAIRRQLGGSGLEDSLADTQFDDPELTREMFAAFAKGGGEFAILQETGKVNVESREMVKAFSSAGLTTQVGDPGDLILERDGVRLGGRRIDVAWNKINTVHWRNYVHENPGQGERWLRILQDGKMVHLNHFGARLVTENKRCLSLLHEEQFTRLYDDSERDLIRKILPWATKFEPNKLVEWEGRRMEVTTLARSARERFVIKEPYDIRGDGVTVGYDCDSDQWNAKISQAVESGWVLQEYIAPLQLPVHHPMSSSAVRMCNLSLDTFVFNGEVAGYGAKASTRHRVNLFQGGQKVAVFVGVR